MLRDVPRKKGQIDPFTSFHLTSAISLSLCRWSDDALRPLSEGFRISAILCAQPFCFTWPSGLCIDLSPSGSHIRAGPEHLQRHADFAALTHGVRFEVIDNLHLKAVLTRDAATGGSANLTINGLVRSVENITVHWRGSEEYTQLLRSGFEAIQTWATPAERLVLCPPDWLA